MVRVLIADDHGLVRVGLRTILENEAGIEVCAEACDGIEAIALAEESQPDLAILDVSMPRLGGLQTLERLRETHPDLKVILLSVHSDAPFIQTAVALGADGYVLKTSPASEMIECIKAVTVGESYFSPTISREVVEKLSQPRDGKTVPFLLLSGREREVLHLIAEGYSAKEVASELCISSKTVEAHRTSLMRKLNVRKATELVRYAVRHGLIEP